jgi:erythronate-4-phosphate dehydrogenase
MKIVADENIPFVRECFSSIGEVEVVPGREISAEMIRDAEVLLVRSITKVDSDLLGGSKVKFVGTATIGYEHIDVDYPRKNNIGFASAPGSNANSVAEYVVAALLSIGKKYKIQLEGKSIGVVGVGNVGSRVEWKSLALGMIPVLNDPPLRRETEDSKYRPLEELFDCDVITLHPPLTFEGIDKTYHLADGKFFDSLKDGCVFINTARGGVTDTKALKAAIGSGRLKAAVLDVWQDEPNIDVELLRMVDISTPHIAGYSLDGKVAGMMMIYEEACEHFGLEVTKVIEDFLPEPEVPEIIIDDVSGDMQQILHETVEQVYAIGRDDFNTREIVMVPEEERGRFFDGLRKNYPVRREFQNTKIELAAEGAENLSKKLEGIGFKVKSEK